MPGLASTRRPSTPWSLIRNPAMAWRTATGASLFLDVRLAHVWHAGGETESRWEAARYADSIRTTRLLWVTSESGEPF